MFNYIFRGYRHLPKEAVQFLEELESSYKWSSPVQRNTSWSEFAGNGRFDYIQHKVGDNVLVGVTRSETSMDGVYFNYQINEYCGLDSENIFNADSMTQKAGYIFASNIHRILKKRFEKQSK